MIAFALVLFFFGVIILVGCWPASLYKNTILNKIQSLEDNH